MFDRKQQNNKRLYAFVKSKKCDSSSVASLKINERTHDSPGETAEILNEQISSEFTKKNMSSLTSLENSSSYPRAPKLNIRVEGVTKILNGLGPHKAPGPDQISSRFLKEMATEISPCLP